MARPSRAFRRDDGAEGSLGAAVDLLAASAVAGVAGAVSGAYLRRLHLPFDAWDQAAIGPAALAGLLLGLMCARRRSARLLSAVMLCAATVGAVLCWTIPTARLDHTTAPSAAVLLLGCLAAGAAGGLAGWTAPRRVRRLPTLPRGRALGLAVLLGTIAGLCMPTYRWLQGDAPTLLPGTGQGPALGLAWLVATAGVAASTRLPHPPLYCSLAAGVVTAAGGLLLPTSEWSLPGTIGYALVVAAVLTVASLLLQAALEEWSEPKDRRLRRRNGDGSPTPPP